MNIDKIGFNPAWVASMDLQSFQKEMELPCYGHIYKGDPKRGKKLKNVHSLCCKAEGKPETDKKHPTKADPKEGSNTDAGFIELS